MAHLYRIITRSLLNEPGKTTEYACSFCYRLHYTVINDAINNER